MPRSDPVPPAGTAGRDDRGDQPDVADDSYRTRLARVQDACTKGGQAEAKKVMKKFLSTAKAKAPEVKDCKSCHSSLIPDFKLTPNALELFVKSGGK